MSQQFSNPFQEALYFIYIYTCITKWTEHSYTLSSPSSTSPCPHPESRHWVASACCSYLLWPAVGGTVGRNSNSRQHGSTLSLARAPPLACSASSSAGVNRASSIETENNSLPLAHSVYSAHSVAIICACWHMHLTVHYLKSYSPLYTTMTYRKRHLYPCITFKDSAFNW